LDSNKSFPQPKINQTYTNKICTDGSFSKGAYVKSSNNNYGTTTTSKEDLPHTTFSKPTTKLNNDTQPRNPSTTPPKPKMTTRQALNNITHPLLKTQLNNYNIPNNCLTLYHTNIHSLPDKHDLLKTHLQLFNILPDIITLSDNLLPESINKSSYPIQQYIHQHTPDISV
jgi:hypothetical protein